MQLGRAVNLFLEGYFSTCERSAKTVAAYRADLNQASQFLGRRRQLTNLSPTALEDWAQQLKNDGYAPASIRRKFAALRVFLGYWVRRGQLNVSPLWHLRLDLKRPAAMPRVLSFEEIQAIKSAAQRRVGGVSVPITAADAGFRALRDLVIVEVLFATGIRIGELAALRLDDYSTDERCFLIHGKGGRERLALLSDHRSAQTVNRYLSLRRNVGSDSPNLLVNAHGRGLSAQGAAKIVTRLATAARIERRVTPHMFRHTVATLLLRNGADIRVVQEFLGHSSIRTTQRYTHVTKEHLMETLYKRHPNRVGVQSQ